MHAASVVGRGFRVLIVSLAAGLLCSWLVAAEGGPVQRRSVSEFGIPEHVSAQARVVPGEAGDEAYCLIEGRIDAAPLVLDLGWYEVSSGRSYRAAYPAWGPAAGGSAALYLMVREHPARGVRPFPSYRKTAVQNRALAPGAGPVERHLDFTPGEDTTAVSVALVISGLAGQIRIGAFSLSDIQAQAQAEYDTVMEEVRAAAAARRPLLPRTLVFSRSQMKYGLEKNYEHVWTDRPLFVNRAYRVPGSIFATLPSYRRILQEVVQYDIDGLAFFPETRNRMEVFGLTERAAVSGVRLLPEFLATMDLEGKSALLEAALASPHSVRIDGKLLITSYVSQVLEPEQWGELLGALRERHGDCFIFLPALTQTVSLRSQFTRGEPISRAAIEASQAFLRRYLDVCDGIYFNYPAAFKNADRTFDEAFYRELFIPVFKSVLSEPPYRGKYFGLSAYHSHSNPDLSMGLLEDGTRTLRHSFEAAMEAEPDVIVLPEWDEVNENTCFRPTTCNSSTTKRILRYYMARIRGRAPTPLPPDDTSVPNLVLGMRAIVSLGERLVIELLNVPDEPDPHDYTVTLSLQDERGRTVRVFDPVTFAAATLQEQRYDLPSEEFAAVRALIPVLSVTGYRGRDLEIRDGLPHVQVRATWNWDYTFVKQPLRELVSVQAAEIGWEPVEPGPEGARILSARVQAAEDLALVELVADGDVVYGFNPSDEPLTADARRETIRIEYRSLRSQPVSGSVRLRGAEAEWMLNLPLLHQPELAQGQQDGVLSLAGQVSSHQRWSCLSIPREQLDTAQLAIRLGGISLDLPLREILSRGMVGAADDTGLHVAVYPYRRQLDMPFHLQQSTAAFTVPLWSWQGTEQVHLRLTAVSGRTYRSRPLLLPAAGGAPPDPVSLRIFSSSTRAPLDVRVDADRIPEIVYAFEPARGAVLLTPAGRSFWASLGGFPDTTSGRGGRHSSLVFMHDAKNGYPLNARGSAPQWVDDEGAPALAFDGVGTFISLPRETLPRRGAFTLAFDIRPDADKDCVLFTHRAHRPASLTLAIREGRLRAEYFGEGHIMHRMDTDLPVPAGEWSRVSVRRDFETLTLQVGDQSRSQAMADPGFDIGPMVFGGFGETSGRFSEETGNPGWFKGRMRHLRILHNVP